MMIYEKLIKTKSNYIKLLYLSTRFIDIMFIELLKIKPYVVISQIFYFESLFYFTSKTFCNRCHCGDYPKLSTSDECGSGFSGLDLSLGEVGTHNV